MGSKKIAIIGCGFYGLSSAIFLAKQGYKVTVYERNPSGMQEASLLNQSRVHAGYHYPRSLATGARSRISYTRFLEDFSEAIKPNVISYYAIANGSKISAFKFEQFCKMINAPISTCLPYVKKSFNYSLIEEIFEVKESFFDSKIMLEILMQRAIKLEVQFMFNQEIKNIRKNHHTEFSIETNISTFDTYDKVIVATYGKTQSGSKEEVKKLTFEVCELVQIEPSASLGYDAITVMDGPYWSLTPWPSFSCSVLTHVRFTPHGKFETALKAEQYIRSGNIESRATVITADVARYFPQIAKQRVIGSKYVIKTILNSREIDDARPIIANVYNGICYLIGGKMDNVYDSEIFLQNYVQE
jgi:hypothetical protein